MTKSVDVLAVMNHIERVLLLCDPLVRSKMHPMANSLEAQAFNARGELREIRAAVAELIEAGMAATEEKMHNGASSRAACARLVAALSRVRGAE